MSYVTLDDLAEELGEDKLTQLTDEDRVGAIDEGRVNKAIQFAVGTFEAYARTRYTLPVPTTEKVKSICLDLAIYHLKRRRATTAEAIDNLKKTLHDPAIKFLEALQGGKAALDLPAAQETEVLPASPDRVLSGNSRPVFTDKKLSSY
ncbi:MAG: gp436 family protein [Pyrinomonadaceae bacterium]